jgi:hypothetical protein
LLAVDEIVKHLALFVWAMIGNDALPFGQSNLLETLLNQWKQCVSIALPVCRQAQNGLRFEARKYLHEEECKAKAWSGATLPVNSYPFVAKEILMQLGCFVFDCLIWQPVGSQRGPLVVPSELGHGHGLEEIGHGRRVVTILQTVIIVT